MGEILRFWIHPLYCNLSVVDCVEVMTTNLSIIKHCTLNISLETAFIAVFLL